jgi:hypothetical protein
MVSWAYILLATIASSSIMVHKLDAHDEFLCSNPTIISRMENLSLPHFPQQKLQIMPLKIS